MAAVDDFEDALAFFGIVAADDPDQASFFDGIERVNQEVHQHLVQLPRIRQDGPIGGIGLNDQLDVFPIRAFKREAVHMEDLDGVARIHDHLGIRQKEHFLPVQLELECRELFGKGEKPRESAFGSGDEVNTG